jgi:hypothetical protein
MGTLLCCFVHYPGHFLHYPLDDFRVLPDGLVQVACALFFSRFVPWDLADYADRLKLSHGFNYAVAGLKTGVAEGLQRPSFPLSCRRHPRY